MQRDEFTKRHNMSNIDMRFLHTLHENKQSHAFGKAYVIPVKSLMTTNWHSPYRFGYKTKANLVHRLRRDTFDVSRYMENLGYEYDAVDDVIVLNEVD